MSGLSKSRIQYHRQCPRRLWLQAYRSQLAEIDPSMQRHFDIGVDLLPITRAHYYHPDMHGSWKIKDVLPTSAPALGYGDLEVRNGVQAQQVFAELMNPDLPDARRTSLRESLLSYCERDTLFW